VSEVFERIKGRIQVVEGDPVAHFGQRWTSESSVSLQRVDQVWMSLVLRWLQQWVFTPAQAEHLMVIIRAQTLAAPSARAPEADTP